MSVVFTPHLRLRELLDSKSAYDVARRLRDELERAAQVRRLPWAQEALSPQNGHVADRISTVPFGGGPASVQPTAVAQSAPPLAQPSGTPSRPPAPALPPQVQDAPGILRRGPANEGERELLAKLLAVAIVRDWVAAPEAAASLAHRLAWIAARAQIDAFPWLDECLGSDQRQRLWSGVGEHIIALEGRRDDASRLEAVSAAWQLSQGTSSDARRVASATAARSENEWVRRILSAGATTPVLSGELGPTPRGPVATFLMAVTLVLFLSRTASVVARYVFAYRRPARLWLGTEALELEQRTELLGRSLSAHRQLIPLTHLSRITRETRYGNLGLYVGLAALVGGTFLGSGLLVDGVRVHGGSGTLLFLGLLCCLLGVGLDLGLSLIDTRKPNHSRLVVRCRRGRSLAMIRVDTDLADALLADIKRQLPRPPQTG